MNFRCTATVGCTLALALAAASVCSAIGPILPGDYNGDGYVDGTDFYHWNSNFPIQNGATHGMGDGDGDGDIDGADFVIWQTNFPSGFGSSAVVPEPSAFVLGLLAVVVLLAFAAHRHRFRRTSLASSSVQSSHVLG